MASPTSFSPSPIQRRGASGTASSVFSSIMPKPFSEAGLPLPSSSRRRNGGFLSISPRLRKRVTLGLLCLVGLFVFSAMTGSGPSLGLNDSHSWADRAKQEPYGAKRTPDPILRAGIPGRGFEREKNLIDEDAMLAENELAVDSAVEAPPKTDAEREADKIAEKNKVLTWAEEKKNQIRALLWFIHKGGYFPMQGFVAPSADKLEKMTGKEFETFLTSMQGGHIPTPDPFLDPKWETDAAMYLGVTVFSKSYCPFSMSAKQIISSYPVQPPPDIIELDEREDGGEIQDMLKSLTGRRTVPNIIVQFQSLGGSDEISLLHAEGVLEPKLLGYSLTQ